MKQGGRPHTCSRPCAFEYNKKSRKKNHEKIRPAQNTQQIHSNPATATTSRRRATKHGPRVSPYSPDSIDPVFVEIGFVQLSQSAKTTNVTHTLTDGRTV